MSAKYREVVERGAEAASLRLLERGVEAATHRLIDQSFLGRCVGWLRLIIPLVGGLLVWRAATHDYHRAKHERKPLFVLATLCDLLDLACHVLVVLGCLLGGHHLHHEAEAVGMTAALVAIGSLAVSETSTPRVLRPPPSCRKKD